MLLLDPQPVGRAVLVVVAVRAVVATSQFLEMEWDLGFRFESVFSGTH
jgi:hypothetical protein